MAAVAGHRLLCRCRTVIYSALLLLGYVTVTSGARYGQRSTTLHVASSSDSFGYHQNSVTIDLEAGFNVDSIAEVNGALEHGVGSDAPSAGRARRSVASQHGDTGIAKTHAHLNDSHRQLIVHWAGEGSDVILALARNSNDGGSSSLYVSSDYGKTFTNMQSQLGNASIHKYYNSPIYNSHYVFTDITSNKLYTSRNYGLSFKTVQLQFKPRTVSMHSTDPNTIVAMDDKSSLKRMYVSQDFGSTWRLMQTGVKSFFWGVQPWDPVNTLYVEREGWRGHNLVVKSWDYFRTSNMVISGVSDFEVKGNFLFATKNERRYTFGKRITNLHLWVSKNREHFQKAQFPGGLHGLDYYIADASEDQVFVCVNHNHSTSHLYISDTAGIRYSLSLERILYFNPNGSNNDTWLRLYKDESFADIHKVAGLRGVFIASQLNTSDTLSLENQHSFITFDKGGMWRRMWAPNKDSTGNRTNCVGYKGCSLHLSQEFSKLYPGTKAVPILSKKSAPGLIVASGTLGKSLRLKPNVFLSRDAGLRWNEVLKGNYFYAFGDHGGIIVAVMQFSLTKEILYSKNMGETWDSYPFYQKPIHVYGLLTEPGEETAVFSVFGSNTGHHSWILIQINATNIYKTKCTQEDYKKWSLSDDPEFVGCLMGRKTIFSRRIAHAQCLNGPRFDLAETTMNCSCTRQDYECDFGFVEDNLEFRVNCKPDPEANITSIHQQPPICPPGHFYRFTKGYRKVPGDTCVGGREQQYEALMYSCPDHEQSEFLLYSNRHEIHQVDLGNTSEDHTLVDHYIQNSVAIEFDYTNNCLFWADIAYDVIKRLCLTGNTQLTTIVSGRMRMVEGLAYDWMGKNLYWVDAGLKKIEVATRDGTHRRVLINGTRHLDKPRAIVVDPHNGYMYWTDWSSSSPRIMKAYMDGDESSIQTIVSGRMNVHWPNGLAIDYQQDLLYWTDAQLDRIMRSDLNGQNRVVLVNGTSHVPHPYAIALFKGEMYWSDWSLRAILAADKNTGQGWHRVINVRSIMDIKILHKDSQNGANPCSTGNGGCSHLCLARPGTRDKPVSRTCLCEDGMMLSRQGQGKDEHCLCADNERMNSTGSCVLADNSTKCAATHFKCANDKCIPRTWQCDHVNDCGDTEQGTDEIDCTYPDCGDGMFTCANRRCITKNWHCDHDNDCGDHSDEVGCRYRNCSSSQFSCANGRCVPLHWRCDGDNDCHDNSDERNCTASRTCAPEQVLCGKSSSQCIPRTWLCDGGSDCPGGTDEANCNITTCRPYYFQCANHQCVLSHFTCDGHRDCSDGSDENLPQCNATTTAPSTVKTTTTGPYLCHTWQFRCRNGHCVWWANHCDGINDCGDYSDEVGCSTNTTSTTMWIPETTPPRVKCPAFQCDNGDCLYSAVVCDGYKDCSNGEDERDCIGKIGCAKGFFACSMMRKCIPESKVCDGRKDCEDGSDEHCNTTTVAGCELKWSLPCLDGDRCLQPSSFCNGRAECQDLSDEPPSCRYESKVVALYYTKGATFVNLTWSSPNTSRPIKYIASYVTDQQQQHNSTITSKPFALFTKLVPDSHYLMFVYVVNASSNQVYYPCPPIHAFTLESVPECPDDLYVHNALVDGLLTAQVTWNKPGATNGRLTEYRIYYEDLSSEKTEVKVLVRAAFLSSLRKGTEGTYTIDLDYLTRLKKYKIWVVAVNKAGESSGCSGLTLVYGKGYIAPLALSVNVLSKSSVSISWKPNSRADLLYRISYRNIWNQPERQVTKKSPIKITGLSAGHTYTFKVQPFNGTSNGSVQLIKAMPTGKPITPPKAVTVTLNGPTEVEVRWAYSSPQVHKFRVFYDFGHTNPEMFALKAKSVETETEKHVHIKKLLACETYTFAVAVTGKNGKSELSDFVSQRTDADRTAPPKNLVARTDNPLTCFNVTWEASCVFNVEPVGYMLEAVEVLDGKTLPPSSVYIDNTNATLVHRRMCKAVRGATYRLRVRTSVKNARFSEPIMFKTAPYQAPRNFRFVGEEDGFLRFMWNDTAEDVPKNRKFMLQYEKDNDPFIDYKTTSANTIEFPKYMLGNGSYSFRVQIIIDGRRGASSRQFMLDTVSVATAEASSQPSSDSNLVAIVAPISAVVVVLVIILLVYVVRHHRLQRSFLSFARSHYDTRSGTTTFTSDDLGEDEDSPMITGFSDDEPLVVA